MHLSRTWSSLLCEVVGSSGAKLLIMSRCSAPFIGLKQCSVQPAFMRVQNRKPRLDIFQFLIIGAIRPLRRQLRCGGNMDIKVSNTGELVLASYVLALKKLTHESACLVKCCDAFQPRVGEDASERSISYEQWSCMLARVEFLICTI
jgi:hypothetical protein